MNTDTVVVSMNVDWDLLRSQKEWLIKMNSGDGLECDYIEGILGIIDTIQDTGASELGERRVFGRSFDA